MRWRSDGKITVFLDGAKDGGFETTEREVETVDFWHRKLIGFFVAFECGASNSGATWVWKSENFGDFIENFADGVIASAADDMKIVVVLHIYNLRMAAGNDEGEERKFRFVATQPVGVDVRFEMMGRVKRNVVKNGGSASSEGADKKGADEAWSMSDGNGVNVGPIELSVSEGLVKDGVDGFDMRTSGNLGNNAAVGGMNIDLRNDDVGKNAVAIFDDGRCGFVTRTLNSKNAHILLL